jgi:hypothetical protein
MNNAAISMGVQVPLLQADSHSFEDSPSSGIAGSYGRTIFSFLKSLHIFHIGCSSLYPYQQ